MTEVKGKSARADSAPDAGYDLRSWQGLTGVLKRARESGLDEDVYAEFRDMVLSYAQSGGDPTLREKIDTLMKGFTSEETKTPHEETAVNTPPLPDTKKQQTIHLGRRTPIFVPPAPVSVPTPSELDRQAIMQTKEPTESTPPPATPPAPEPVMPSAPEITVSQEVGEVSRMGLEAKKARISEIKRQVHNMFGNPVTLMDAGNGIGREYMNALLTAMKASGGGSTVSIDVAMQNLENAFRSIEEFSKTAQPVSIPTTPEPPIEVPPVSESVVEAEKSLEKDLPTAEASPLPPEPIQSPVAPISSEPEVPTEPGPHEPNIREVQPIPEPSVEEGVTEPSVNVTFPITPPIPAYGEVVAEKSESEKDEKLSLNLVLERLRQTSAERLGTPPPIDEDASRWTRDDAERTVTAPRNTKPDSHTEPPAPPSSEPDIIRVEKNSDLDTQEINAALDQLLHEWRLFRSSGLLGLGAGGREHPLYKKLEYLPMLIVVNGDWDGARSEEKASIRDYMNAWRHEQGVVFNPNETFERYLRRVLKKVLIRQKEALGA